MKVVIKTKDRTYKLNKYIAILLLLLLKKYDSVNWILDNWEATTVEISIKGLSYIFEWNIKR